MLDLYMEETEVSSNYLTKEKFKNQVVSMRHNVKRARVQIIHKISRMIKSLKTKKGSEEEKQKNNVKAERLGNEILTMKMLKEDEVAEFCLTNKTDPNKMLSDNNEELRMKVLAKLSMHKSLSTVVANFRMKFPNWEKDVVKAFSCPKKRRRKLELFKSDLIDVDIIKTKVVCKSSDNVDTSVIFDKESETLKENNENILELKNTTKEEFCFGTSYDSFDSDGDKGECLHDPNDVQDNQSLTFDKNATESSDHETENKEMIDQEASNAKDMLKKEIKNDDSEQMPFSENELTHKDSELSTEITNLHHDYIEKIEKSKYVDPFFVTSADEAYLSYAKIPSDCDEDLEVNLGTIRRNSFKSEFLQGKNIRYHKENCNRKFNYFNPRISQENQNRLRHDSTRNKEPTKNEFKEKKFNLHPSWEAKKKFSAKIQTFQGNKIIFE